MTEETKDLGTLMKFLEYVNFTFITDNMLRFNFYDEMFNETDLRTKMKSVIVKTNYINFYSTTFRR